MREAVAYAVREVAHDEGQDLRALDRGGRVARVQELDHRRGKVDGAKFGRALSVLEKVGVIVERRAGATDLLDDVLDQIRLVTVHHDLTRQRIRKAVRTDRASAEEVDVSRDRRVGLCLRDRDVERPAVDLEMQGSARLRHCRRKLTSDFSRCRRVSTSLEGVGIRRNARQTNCP
jgi:hypothetical protein